MGRGEPCHGIAPNAAIPPGDVRPVGILFQPEKNTNGSLARALGQHNVVALAEFRFNMLSSHTVPVAPSSCIPPICLRGDGGSFGMYICLAFSSLALLPFSHSFSCGMAGLESAIEMTHADCVATTSGVRSWRSRHTERSPANAPTAMMPFTRHAVQGRSPHVVPHNAYRTSCANVFFGSVLLSRLSHVRFASRAGSNEANER